MSFNYSTVASKIKATHESIKSQYARSSAANSGDAANWMNTFADAYDTDANAGSFVLGNVVMTSNAGLLKFNNVGNTTGSCSAWANAIAAYWAAQLTPGAPELESIVSVSNDAAKIAGPITSSLLAMDFSSDIVGFSPNYENICKIIEDQVKTIVWTIVELNSVPASVTFSNSIS